MIGSLLFWSVLPNSLIFLLLIWWRYFCEWQSCGCQLKFPTRGHIVLLILCGFVPLLNIVELILIILNYIFGRAADRVVLKKNKFNKFWFDVD